MKAPPRPRRDASSWDWSYLWDKMGLVLLFMPQITAEIRCIKVDGYGMLIDIDVPKLIHFYVQDF